MKEFVEGANVEKRLAVSAFQSAISASSSTEADSFVDGRII